METKNSKKTTNDGNLFKEKDGKPSDEAYCGETRRY